MLSSVLFTTVLAAVLVNADPSPSEPSPGSVFKEGENCRIAWDVDATGTWKTMNIELMSGSNWAMNHITTVATVDGTDATQSPFEYPCPEVTPNSAIYFYQFTTPASSSILWTTRFTIAAADGSTTAPANTTQPNGDAIPWGTGDLTDPTKATPAPAHGSASASASVVGSSSASVFVASVTASGSSAPAVSSASSHSASSSRSTSQSATAAAANATGTGAAQSGNGAIGRLALDSRLTQAAASLGVVAFAFAALL